MQMWLHQQICIYMLCLGFHQFFYVDLRTHTYTHTRRNVRAYVYVCLDKYK